MTRKTLQKLIGLALVILNIIWVLISHDLTAAVLLVPLGLYAIFTKEDILTPVNKGGASND